MHEPSTPAIEPDLKNEKTGATGTARGSTHAENASPFPPAGDTPDMVIPTPPQNRDTAFLHRTLPCRQSAAEAFLLGKNPGVMQSYAPDAEVSDTDGFVEGDETVHRLAHWREEAIY